MRSICIEIMSGIQLLLIKNLRIFCSLLLALPGPSCMFVVGSRTFAVFWNRVSGGLRNCIEMVCGFWIRIYPCFIKSSWSSSSSLSERSCGILNFARSLMNFWAITRQEEDLEMKRTCRETMITNLSRSDCALGGVRRHLCSEDTMISKGLWKILAPSNCHRAMADPSTDRPSQRTLKQLHDELEKSKVGAFMNFWSDITWC